MTLASFIALIARREFVRVVNRRGFLLSTLLVPIGIVALVGFLSMVGGEESSQPGSLSAPVYLVNESPIRLQNVPASPGGAEIRVITADAARTARGSGEAAETYRVGPDFLETGEVVRIADAKPQTDMKTLDRLSSQEAALTSYLRSSILIERGLSAAELTRVTQPFSFFEQTGPSGAPEKAAVNVGALLVPYAFSLLFVMSIMMTSGYLLQSVSEEKENRVVEIVLTSVPTLGLMTGKLLGLGAAGLLQVLVWVATVLVGVPLLGKDVPFLAEMTPSPILLALAVVYFVLGYVLYGSIYCAAGAVGSNTREATQFGALAGMLAVVPIMMTIVFMQDPSGPLPTALALFPLTAPAAMLQIVAFAAAPPWLLIVASLALLAAGAVIVTVLSARLFRAATLLSGSRPSITRIVATLAKG